MDQVRNRCIHSKNKKVNFLTEIVAKWRDGGWCQLDGATVHLKASERWVGTWVKWSLTGKTEVLREKPITY
jgi:hypothetical protein